MPKRIFVAAVLLLSTALVLAQETRELNLRGDRFQPLTWERLGEKGVMGAPSPFPESK